MSVAFGFALVAEHLRYRDIFLTVQAEVFALPLFLVERRELVPVLHKYGIAQRTGMVAVVRMAVRRASFEFCFDSYIHGKKKASIRCQRDFVCVRTKKLMISGLRFMLPVEVFSCSSFVSAYCANGTGVNA